MIKTIKDILYQVGEYQGRLGEFYRALNAKTDKQRVKMLLDYLSDREKQRQESLGRFEESLPDRLRGSQPRFQPPDELLAVREEPGIPGKEVLTVDDVIEIAVNMNRCLLDLYEQMIKNEDSNEIRELFNNLLNMENRAQRELVRDAQELKDL